VIVLIVALYFRSVGAPLLTLVTAGVAYVVAVRGLAWAGERFDITAPSEVEPVLVVLLLGLVTDYTVFFMADARRRLLRGEPRLPAARHATARIAPVVLTAGIVVAGGTASLLAGRTEFFRVFGPGLALCALVVTVVCVTFVPAVLGLAGPRLFGRRVRDARPAGDRPAGAVAARLDDDGGGSARRNRWRLRMASALGGLRASRSQAREEGGRVLPAVLARLMATRPVAILVVVACVGALGFAASRAQTADLGVSYLPSLPAESEPRRAADDAARGFGPGVLAPTEVIVEQRGIAGRPDRLVACRRCSRASPGSRPCSAPRARGHAAGGPGARARWRCGALRRPARPRADRRGGDRRVRRAARPHARAPAAGRPARGRAGPVRRRDRAGGRERRRARGRPAARGGRRVPRDVPPARVFLRAVVAAALLVLGSVLAFAASFGLTALLLPRALGGTDFVFYVPLVAGVLLVGLGSDYNVFIAGRIREELRRRRLREAIATAVPAASRAITVAGITLAATFALLALVPLRPFRELALLMTIGVLVDALVVRPLLIPTLIAAVGPRAWWPGRPQRPPRSRDFLARVKERAGVEGIDAERITHATLATLAERIPAREAAEISAQLPPSLGRALRADGPAREPFGAEEFVARVARRSRTSADVARGDAVRSWRRWSRRCPGTEVDYMRAILSADYRFLLGDAPDVGRPPEPVG
jgi:RND superfamily putative drug exporter